MLAIIVGIAKITGIILLCLFLLALVLLCMVLFIPLRYRGRIVYRDGLLIDSGISWCLGLLSLEIKLEKGLDMGFKVFGFRLKGKKKKEDESKEDLREEETGGEEAEGREREGDAISPEAGKKEEASEKEVSEKEVSEQEAPEQKAFEQDELLWERGKDRKKKKIKSKTDGKKAQKKSLKQKLGKFVKSFRKKTAYLLENAEKLKKTIRSRRLKKGLRKIWDALWKLLRHIWIKKIGGRIRFGFEDPYTTGRVLSYAAFFYPAYSRQLELVPFFDRVIMEADVELKGRVQIFYLLWILGRLWFDKDFKYVYKKYRAWKR